MEVGPDPSGSVATLAWPSREGRSRSVAMLAPKQKLWIAGLVVLLAGVGVFALADQLDLAARMDRVVERVRAAGPVPFFAAMTLLPAVGFPLSAFTLVAGPVFGPTLGVGVVVGLAILGIAINVA